jgi:hypothetical protein
MKVRVIEARGLQVLLCGLVLAAPVFAGPADYVYTPTVEYGEREIDIKYGSTTPEAGDRLQAASVGFGYGATESWFTEIYLKHERDGSQEATLAEWENKFALTEPGKYPVDAGVITELEVPLSKDLPWEFKFGPLFQTQVGKLQVNGNLLFERAFGKADESGMPYVTNLNYQLQVKYRLQQTFEFGLQGLGELGKWNDWSPSEGQTHVLGPAAFGKIRLGNRRAVKYNAAWLFGTGKGSPNHTFRTQIEYEY